MAREHYSRDCEQSSDSDVELQHILRRLSRGDILVVPSIEHLSRRWPAVREILTFLEDRGVILAPRLTSLKPGEMPEVAFRRDLKRAASARAAARGAYAGNSGRPVKGDRTLAVKLHAAGIAPETIADVLGVSARTVSRYLSRQDHHAAT
jgi:DNA invertase Pin-like site-specific DNA recombinase